MAIPIIETEAEREAQQEEAWKALDSLTQGHSAQPAVDSRGYTLSRRCELCLDVGSFNDTGLCTDCEAEPLVELGLAVTAFVPDATPARVTALLETALAVERLRESGHRWGIQPAGESEQWFAVRVNGRIVVEPSLSEAVAAALEVEP